MATLVPNYLDIDFNTVISRIKEQLAESDTFRDYNYEGANITILMELLAYINELNVYFLNKLAKNVHIETADIYEAVNRNSRMMGYEPKGPVSSTGTVSVTVTGATPGHQYRIDEFTQLKSTETYEGDTILFANTTTYTMTPTASSFSFDMIVRQGEVATLTGYTGKNLIDNELLLPSNYAYDNNLDDIYPSLAVYVNGSLWSRVSDFYDDLSPLLTEENVYMFIYDRYGRSKLVFSSSRNVPSRDAEIQLTVLRSLGINSNVAAATITEPNDSNFMYDVTAGEYVDNELITIINNSATTGGADAETIDTIKNNAKAGLHAQFRNVTSVDYESHLESRSDVVVAKIWGEQDISPSGAVQDFNKVYISVVPTRYSTQTINVSAGTFTTDWDETGAIYIPSAFSTTWQDELKEYVEPRKMISAYETFEKPTLVYFSFEFGVRKKRLANITRISNDIKNKLDYYFRAENQDFNSVINFNDIIEFLLDQTEVSGTDDFAEIANIRNLNLRDIDVSKRIYEPNNRGDYPQYVDAAATWTGENQLRRIKLGLKQFPVLHLATVKITEEN